jgi:hypothetical protein
MTAPDQVDARWQMVTCRERDCKRTYQCTPENDYYDNTTLEDGQCTRCLIRSKGMDPETTPVLVIDPRTMTEVDPRDLALRPDGGTDGN